MNPVRIKIQNFQSIEEVTIDVDGFTCITGPTNVGKSAIIRAISSAILNNPVGGMVRKGASFCSVELQSKDWGFKWEKNDKGVNRVWLPGKDKPLDKLGQTQVLEVAKMGFISIQVGDDEVQPWFAPQFQSKGRGPLFLLDQSGPRVTDFISEVSRLTVLQDAIVLASRGKRRLNDAAKSKSEEANKLKETLTRLSGIESLIGLVSDLDGQYRSIEEYEKKIEIGEKILRKVAQHREIMEVLDKAPNISIPKDNCKDLIQKMRTLGYHWRSLNSAAQRVIVVRGQPVQVPEGVEAKQSIEKLKKISAISSRMRTLKAASTLFDATVNIPSPPSGIHELRKLSVFSRKIQALRQEIKSMDQKMESIQSQLSEVQFEIESIPSCPTCLRPMSPEHAQHTSSRRKILSA